MNLSVHPIFSIRERNRGNQRPLVRKPVDSKVRGVVLEKIGATTGALLPFASAPQIITFLLPEFESGKMGQMLKKKKSKLLKTPLPRKTPIGLMSVDLEGWVNALMQFILYVPGFADSFTFAPRSLFPIQEFIDQYHQDLADGRAVSSANGSQLFRLFTFRFPNCSPKEIFQSLIHLLKPKWELFRNVFEALRSRRSTDLFFSMSELKKQIFSEPNCYYDLDAFIEKRPDGGRVNYIAYVKVAGSWYQCDNDRITQIRSDMLSMSLQRAILSHYKEIAPLIPSVIQKLVGG